MVMSTLCIGFPLSPSVTVPLKVPFAWLKAGKLNNQTMLTRTAGRKAAVKAFIAKSLIMTITSVNSPENPCRRRDEWTPTSVLPVELSFVSYLAKRRR
jgi:hypothetical protein